MATSAKALSFNSDADNSNSSNSSTETKRVNVIFSQDQYAALQRLAASQGINLSDALRQAINVSELIVNANADKSSGKRQEVATYVPRPAPGR